MPRRGSRRSALPALPIARRPVPAWLKGRCCRCLVPGHRAAVCCDPFRCSRCLANGHRASDCRHAWRPLSLLAPANVPLVSARSRRSRRVVDVTSSTRTFPLKVYSGNSAAPYWCLVFLSCEAEVSMQTTVGFDIQRRSRRHIFLL
jgi:hypothetical protein